MRRFGVDLPYEGQVTWGITRLEPEQVHACVLETHSDELIATAEPYPGAVETVNRWHAAGHFIHITSPPRRPTPTRRTERWLRRDRPRRTTSSTARSTRSRAAARSASTC